MPSPISPIYAIQRKQKKRSFAWLWISLLVLGMIGYMLGPVWVQNWQEDKLRESGLPAKALIIELHDTGNRYNDNPEIRLVLQIEMESKKSYKTEYKSFFSVIYLPQLQPGKVIAVKVDPNDPQNIVPELNVAPVPNP